jgi:serine protease
LNLSLGGSGNPANDIICSAITAAKNKGTITIVAAGNENIDVSTTVPAGCTDAITVGAVDSNVKKASFSNYGSKVDVSAPGVNIYSSYLNGSYATLNGTSMATPFVAGLAAAILAYNPSFSTDKMRTLFKDPNNTLPVNSSVNLGRYINMSKIMTSLAVPNDSLIDGAPTNSGSTNTGTTNS